MSLTKEKKGGGGGGEGGSQYLKQISTFEKHSIHTYWAENAAMEPYVQYTVRKAAR